MTTLTKESLVEMGGNYWAAGAMERVYISQEIFNKITGQCASLNETKWKFYVDLKTMQAYRNNGKKPVSAKIAI